MIDTVAWTLVHFLWQGTLVWFLVSVQLRFLREARTRLRRCLRCDAPHASSTVRNFHAARGDIGLSRKPVVASSTTSAGGHHCGRFTDDLDAVGGRALGKRRCPVLSEKCGRPGVGVYVASQGFDCFAP
jgi:hypothetical protein